jgi:hypothetical protein
MLERRPVARKKSWLRRRLNSRWLVWKTMRGLGLAWPALARRLAFPLRSVSAIEQATQVLENERYVIAQPVSSRDRQMVLLPAQANDTHRPSIVLTNGEGRSIAYRQAASLKDCALLGHSFSVVDKRGEALSLWPWTPNWNFARPALLRQRKAGPEPHLPLMGSTHYYHAYANDLLPLWDYLERLHPARKELAVVARPAKAPADFASRAAVVATFPGVRFVEVRARERLEIANLRWVFLLADNQEWIAVEGAAIRRFAGAVRRHYGLPEQEATERLFVSRGANRIRRLEDEPDILAKLEGLGFSSFMPQSSDHLAQVKRFGAARIIVAVHGAALTNLIFAAPGAQVIEIFPANFVKSTFWWLSQRMGLSYRAVIGGDGDYDQAFRAGAEAVEQAVSQALAEPNR